MPTTEEIQRYIDTHVDMFGVTTADLIGYTPWEYAKPKLTEEYVAKIESGEEDPWMVRPIDRDTILEEMRDYMEFALDKAHNGRGLSAQRSIIHFRCWLFLLDDEEGLAFLRDADNFPPYGFPMLRWVAEKYELPYNGPGPQLGPQGAQGDA